MVGLPGTGLGGVFYALLVVWMALREGWRAYLGASDRGRWLKIGSLWALLGCILLALWLESWALKAVLQALADPGAPQSAAVTESVSALPPEGQPSEAGLIAANALVPAFAAATFVVLGLLMALVHAARFAYPRQIVETAPMPARRQTATRSLEQRSGITLVNQRVEELEPAE